MKYRIKIYINYAVIFVASSLIFLKALADPAPEKSTSVRIAGMEYQLMFEDEDITHDLRKVIKNDIELNLSHLTQIDFRRVSQNKSEPSQKYTVVITHWLDVGKQSKWYPESLDKYFGGAVFIDGEYKFILHHELITEYKEALQVKKKNPVMFNKIDNFLDLLKNRNQLVKLAQDKRAAADLIYFSGKAPGNVERLYKEIPDYADFVIRPPSLLDIRPLDEVMKKKIDSNVYVFTTLIEKEEGSDDAFKTPLGAYFNGEWHIWVPKMP